MNNFYCRNCGKKGHKYKSCYNSRLSYGIILFNDKNEIVMVERKDSISYIEFIRGKYGINDVIYIQLLVDRMSNLEKDKLKRYDFKQLWYDIWFNNNNKDYDICLNKYKTVNITDYLNNSSKKYQYNEWEIPKGRRTSNETNKDCAMREFEEETNINKSEYELYDNILPLEEEYTGSNTVKYKNVYYIGKIKDNNKILSINPDNPDQISEIKTINWFIKDNCIKNIREYSDYKLKIIEQIFKFIHSDKKNIIL